MDVFPSDSTITDLRDVRAILFDAVGTVMTPEPSVAQAYHAAGRRHGSELSRDEVSRRFSAEFRRTRTSTDATNECRERENWRQIVANVFTDVVHTESLFDELWEHFAVPAHWRLFDDVQECWQQLAGRGLILGIASNFDERLVGICQAHPPLNECDHVFWSAQMGIRKPNLEFFKRVAERLQLEPAQLLLIGDDLHNDYWGAKTANWRSLLINRKSANPIPGHFPRADLIHSIAEILELLAL
jgi:putative hydrolase of the HAD superfamily